MTRLNDTLPELMRRATDDLEPVSTDLLERTVAQGLRHRRRRNTLRIGAAATAALATTGLIAAGTQVLAGKQEAPAATTSARDVTEAAPKSPAVTQRQTLATLKQLVQAPGRTVTSPLIWGHPGFNGAAVVVNDGKGASQVVVNVGTDTVPASCEDGPPNCIVRSDGATVTWSRNEPVYSGSRQQIHKVVGNRVEIQYRDGREISLTNYNGPQEKNADHTRPEPLYSVQQLMRLAEDKSWRFPPAQPVPTGDPKADRNKSKATK